MFLGVIPVPSQVCADELAGCVSLGPFPQGTGDRLCPTDGLPRAAVDAIALVADYEAVEVLRMMEVRVKVGRLRSGKVQLLDFAVEIVVILQRREVLVFEDSPVDGPVFEITHDRIFSLWRWGAARLKCRNICGGCISHRCSRLDERNDLFQSGARAFRPAYLQHQAAFRHDSPPVGGEGYTARNG